MAALATPSAAQRTLTVPELLENILLFVHPIQLFALQRVNTTFKDAIEASVAVQKCMLLEPSDKVNLEYVKAITEHPRIQRKLDPFEFVKVVKMPEKYRYLAFRAKDTFVMEHQYKDLQQIDWDCYNNSCLQPNQSWCKMSLTSPLKENLKLAVGSRLINFGSAEDTQVITLDQLRNEAIGLIEECWSEQTHMSRRVRKQISDAMQGNGPMLQGKKKGLRAVESSERTSSMARRNSFHA